jgi:hypothetical protein
MKGIHSFALVEVSLARIFPDPISMQIRLRSTLLRSCLQAKHSIFMVSASLKTAWQFGAKQEMNRVAGIPLSRCNLGKPLHGEPEIQQFGLTQVYQNFSRIRRIP